MPQVKAQRIMVLDIHTPAMRAFHMAWLAFFGCFLAWLALAPLMQVIRDDLRRTKTQVENLVIGAGIGRRFNPTCSGRDRSAV